jgi:hypothetical protein
MVVLLRIIGFLLIFNRFNLGVEHDNAAELGSNSN